MRYPAASARNAATSAACRASSQPSSPRHQPRNRRRHRFRGARIEEQRPRPPRQHILDRSRHLVARRPDDFGPGVGQVRMKRRRQ